MKSLKNIKQYEHINIHISLNISCLLKTDLLNIDLEVINRIEKNESITVRNIWLVAYKGVVVVNNAKAYLRRV
jgi:hypothetical protein